LLVGAFWRVRKWDTPVARLVWIFFLYVFLGYWINGMSLASGYNSDVNLWFIFALAIFYKYWMTDEDWLTARSPAEQMIQEFDFA
jgi:hypothetical protein